MCLPSELLLTVFSGLSRCDLQRLRLVNRLFYDCASQYLIQDLRISAHSESFEFWDKVSSSGLFRRGITSLVYNTELTHQSKSRSSSRQDVIDLGNSDELLASAIEQCHDVYQKLRVGFPNLTSLKAIAITDQIIRKVNVEPSTQDGPSKTNRHHNGELSLLILLSALSSAKFKPSRFDINLQTFISCSNSRAHSFSASIPSTTPVISQTLFDRSLETAQKVFMNLRELNIVTEGPETEEDSAVGISYVGNLLAFVSTAGPQLEDLQIAVRHMPVLQDVFEVPLFTTVFLKKIPVRWPRLRLLELRGFDLSGFDLIAFLSQQPLLHSVILQDVYLTRNSPDWTSLIDDLCSVLGVQFEDQEIGASNNNRKRCTTIMPMERSIDPVFSSETTISLRCHLLVQLNLDHVFEPWDYSLEGALKVGAEELNDFFKGLEGNPRRGCYESFLIPDER